MSYKKNMDILVNIVLILLDFSFVFGSTLPLPPLAPKPCKLQIRHLNGQSEVPMQRVSVLEGTDVVLQCEAMCSSEHYIPLIKWITPDNRIVWDLPGKMFSSSDGRSSHRLQTLNIKNISEKDLGTYKCVGWIGYWTDVSINIDFDTGESDDIRKRQRKDKRQKLGK